MQRDLVPLWSLLEACRDGTSTQQRQLAEAVAEELRANGAMTVELRGETLSVDDYPVVSCADSYAATHGVRRIMKEACTSRVAFAQAVSRDALREWAAATVTGCASSASGRGVEVAAQPARAATPPLRSMPESSRLASVYAQQQLFAALPPLPSVSAEAAKAVIERVVERLLLQDRGLEPVVLLQADEALLERSAAVAVLSVVMARAAGWPLERLDELGVAGLLHDLGVALDLDAPAESSFRWLLQRGCEDLWLRAALVARGWREEVDDEPVLGAVQVVRLAAAAVRGGADEVARLRRAGRVDEELAAVAQRAIAG